MQEKQQTTEKEDKIKGFSYKNNPFLSGKENTNNPFTKQENPKTTQQMLKKVILIRIMD